MSPRLRHSTGLALLLALTAAVTGCARRETAAPAASTTAKPADVVRLNLNPAIGHAPFMIAKDEGFFKKEGIDAHLITIDSPSALLALTSGRLDVMSSALRSGYFNAILRGATFQIVADRGHSEPGPCSSEAFAAPVALADEIGKSGGNLRGRKFMLFRGGATEYMVDRLLKKRGLTRADVELAQMPSADYGSLNAQGFDAIRYTQEPTLSNGLTRGLLKIVATDDEFAPSNQYAVMLYGKRLLQDDPDLGRRFMRAYLRGVRQYNEGKTDRNVAIISKYTKFPPEIVRQACWQKIANDGQVQQQAIQDFLSWALAADYLDGEIAVSRWWNPSFIDAANQSLLSP